MRITMASYIETLQNTSGRFKTLKNMYPRNTPAKEPYIRITAAGYVCFIAECGEKRYLATAVPPDSPYRDSILTACRTLAVWNCPVFPETHFLPDEMLLFDGEGVGRRADLVLQSYADDIHTVFRKHAFLADRSNERTLLESIVSVAECFDERSIVHGRLNARSLRFDDNLDPLVFDYPFTTSQRIAVRDNGFLLRAAIITYLVGCDAQLYILMNERDWFSSDMFDRCKKEMLSASQYYRIGSLEAAIRLTDNPTDRIAVNEAISALSKTAFHDMELLKNLIGDRFRTRERVNVSIGLSGHDDTSGRTHVIDFTKCEYAGDFSDGYYCFKMNDTWGYADRDGNVLPVERELLYAQDFYESRAVVKTSGGFALISREGKIVMDDTFEDMSWCGQYGTVTAMRNGQWRMYDRNGQVISDAYDWMDDCSEELSVVERNGRFGYIDRYGNPAIELKYDHAGHFLNGKAKVESGNMQYEIDRSGKPLNVKS